MSHRPLYFASRISQANKLKIVIHRDSQCPTCAVTLRRMKMNCIINTARIPNGFGGRTGNICDRRWKHLQQRLRCIKNGLKFPKNLDSARKWADSASKTESPGFKCHVVLAGFFELVKFQENELTIYYCD